MLVEDQNWFLQLHCKYFERNMVGALLFSKWLSLYPRFLVRETVNKSSFSGFQIRFNMYTSLLL